MSWNGSLTNRVLERAKAPAPEVGMGVTECMWSDRCAWEVIAVKDERHVTVRRMKTVMKPGTDWLDQEYDYFSDENGEVAQLFKTQKGRWVQRIGRSYGSSGWHIGRAVEYRDPSF